MENEIERLDRFYYSFIDYENPKDFFNGLCDYCEFIDSVPEFERVSTELLSRRKLFEARVKETEKHAMKKLGEVHDEILKYITKNNIESIGIKQAFREYDEWASNRAIGTNTIPDNLHDLLSDVIEYLYDMPEHKEFASRYVVISKGSTFPKFYLYPKEISDYFDALNELTEKGKSELWGQVGQIKKLYNTIKNGREKRKELIRQMNEENSNKAKFELAMDGSAKEWRWIEDDNFNNIRYFDVSKIRPIAVRFQNHILKEATIIAVEDKEVKNKSKETPTTFSISLKDREIWVNNYLLSKPHATSVNYEFFEYILSKPANKKIERKTLPDKLGVASLKSKLSGDKFKKSLTSLGFKGEILKAFFYNRGKNEITFRGDKITKKQLEDAGINITIFIQELELANAKHSPR